MNTDNDFTYLQPPLNSEMKELMQELRDIVSNSEVVKAFDEAIANVVPTLPNGKENQWVGKKIDYFVRYFENWFTFLPTPKGGLGKIMPFTHFYLENKKAFDFLNYFESRKTPDSPYSKEIFNWTVKFIKARGRFMDSPDSLMYIDKWLDDPSTKIDDFVIPEGGFKSFNEFFTRELKTTKNPRPIASPDDNSVVVASGDTEINFIESNLTINTPLKVKSRYINVHDLLKGSKKANTLLVEPRYLVY